MKQDKKPSKSILLGTTYVPYQVRVSTRARRWRLTVTANVVEVVLPEGSRLHPERILQQYADWIIEKQAKQKKRQARLDKHALPEDQLLYHGKPVILEIRQANLLEKQQVTHSMGRIRVVAGKLPGPRVLQKWLARQTEEAVLKQINLRAAQMGVRPGSLSIRNQRTRWGSCSSRGALSFNWRLIMAPPEVLDYVVVHELAHMKEQNHSKAFWKIVSQYSPDYLKHRQWLKQNQAAMWPGLFD